MITVCWRTSCELRKQTHHSLCVCVCVFFWHSLLVLLLRHFAFCLVQVQLHYYVLFSTLFPFFLSSRCYCHCWWFCFVFVFLGSIKEVYRGEVHEIGQWKLEKNEDGCRLCYCSYLMIIRSCCDCQQVSIIGNCCLLLFVCLYCLASLVVVIVVVVLWCFCRCLVLGVD